MTQKLQTGDLFTAAGAWASLGDAGVPGRHDQMTGPHRSAVSFKVDEPRCNFQLCQLKRTGRKTPLMVLPVRH